MIDTSRLSILETTLRDGSYVIDFQFTARDAGWLAGRLEAYGMNYIEIGHGLGIGASQAHAPAAATDAEYIVAAKAAVSHAKIGMFAIPGLVKLDDIAAAADLGLDFLRVDSETGPGEPAPDENAMRSGRIPVGIDFHEYL